MIRGEISTAQRVNCGKMGCTQRDQQCTQLQENNIHRCHRQQSTQPSQCVKKVHQCVFPLWKQLLCGWSTTKPKIQSIKSLLSTHRKSTQSSCTSTPSTHLTTIVHHLLITVIFFNQIGKWTNTTMFQYSPKMNIRMLFRLSFSILLKKHFFFDWTNHAPVEFDFCRCQLITEHIYQSTHERTPNVNVLPMRTISVVNITVNVSIKKIKLIWHFFYWERFQLQFHIDRCFWMAQIIDNILFRIRLGLLDKLTTY